MGLPKGLKRVGESIQSKPKPQPTPAPLSSWADSRKRDGVTIHEGADAEMYFSEITPAMKTGFAVEAALEESKRQRWAAQKEAARQHVPIAPAPTSFHVSAKMSDYLAEFLKNREGGQS